jgi:acyl carrier protein
MTDTLDKIIKILRGDPFNLDSEITKNSKIKNFERWDSLKHLMFLMEIEKEFSIEITPEEVNEIVLIKDLIKKIEI